MSSSKSVLVIGTVAGVIKLSANDMVKLCPRGAYTTARTSGRRSVFEFEAQVARTAESARLMMDDETARGVGIDAASRSAGNAVSLRTIMKTDFARAIGLLARETHGDAWKDSLRPSTILEAGTGGASSTDMNFGEFKLTCVLFWGAAVPAAVDALLPLLQPPFYALGGPSPSLLSDDGDARRHLESGSEKGLPPTLLITHVTQLPTRRPPPVTVIVKGAPRHNALAKDSEWVRQRTSLEAEKPSDVEEILLMDTGTGAVLEGTQTNFFAVSADGVVQTAGTGVLAGTVRKLVLEVCQEQGIPVSLNPPVLAEAETWTGAFLSSTSRLVLPINSVRYSLPQASNGGELEEQKSKELNVNGVVMRIELGVRAAVGRHSVDVFNMQGP